MNVVVGSMSLSFFQSCRIFSLCMLFIEAPFLGYFIPQLEFIVKYTSYIKSWMRSLIYFGWVHWLDGCMQGSACTVEPVCSGHCDSQPPVHSSQPPLVQ